MYMRITSLTSLRYPLSFSLAHFFTLSPAQPLTRSFNIFSLSLSFSPIELIIIYSHYIWLTIFAHVQMYIIAFVYTRVQGTGMDRINQFQITMRYNVLPVAFLARSLSLTNSLSFLSHSISLSFSLFRSIFTQFSLRSLSRSYFNKMAAILRKYVRQRVGFLLPASLPHSQSLFAHSFTWALSRMLQYQFSLTSSSFFKLRIEEKNNALGSQLHRERERG